MGSEPILFAMEFIGRMVQHPELEAQIGKFGKENIDEIIENK